MSEPLTAEEERVFRGSFGGPHGRGLVTIEEAQRLLATLDAARTPEPAGVRTLPCGACYHGPHENTKCSDCECDFTPAAT